MSATSTQCSRARPLESRRTSPAASWLRGRAQEVPLKKALPRLTRASYLIKVMGLGLRFKKTLGPFFDGFFRTVFLRFFFRISVFKLFFLRPGRDENGHFPVFFCDSRTRKRHGFFTVFSGAKKRAENTGGREKRSKTPKPFFWI